MGLTRAEMTCKISVLRAMALEYFVIYGLDHLDDT